MIYSLGFYLHDQNQLGEERVYSSCLLSGYIPSLRAAGAGTETEFTEECCLMGYASWLAQLTSYTQQNLLSRGRTTHIGLDPSITNKDNKYPYRLICRAISWKHFLNGGSFFSKDSRLCQAGIKTSQRRPQRPRLSLSVRFTSTPTLPLTSEVPGHLLESICPCLF